MILDVGCGSSPKGHVNIDLFVGETPHQTAEPINPKLIPNFIKASAEYLPFCDNSFEIVICSHVVEHLHNPTKAVLDMVRVATKEVICTVPHRYKRKTWYKFGQTEMHKHYFGASTTVEWLRNLGLSFEMEILYDGFPSKFLPILRLPSELRMRIRARKE